MKNEDHYVPSNRHVNSMKGKKIKRLERSTPQRAKPKKTWVPKSIMKEMHSQASKEQEKFKAIWIPKSLLKDLNIENKSKLTFKLPKASTPSSSKNISKTISKPSTPSSSKIYLLPHTSIPQAISSMIPPSFQHPSRCMLMLILPNISATLMKSSKAYTYFPYMNAYPSSTPSSIFSTISLPLPYQHLWACHSMVLAYPSNRSTIQIEKGLNSFQKL